MTDTNPIKIYDESGKIVDEANPCIFTDTVVESYSKRVFTIHNTTKHYIEIIEDNNDPTIQYEDYPKKLGPNESGKFTVIYHPTFEHLKATESAIGFKFRVV